jgi:hypothetical protein
VIDRDLTLNQPVADRARNFAGDAPQAGAVDIVEI